MEKILYYKSFDGVKFDDREECISHELDILQAKAKDHFIFFDYNFEVMTSEYDGDNLEDAHYILIKNEAAAEYIEYLGNLCDTVHPDGVGFWMWDEMSGKYRSITDDEVKRLEYKLEIIKKYR